MTRIFANANYDFIGFRRKAILATITLFVIGMGALIFRGINYSIEFTGGTLVDFKSAAPVDLVQLRSALTAAGIDGPEITPFGGTNEYEIRARVGTKAADANNISVAKAAVDTALVHVVGPGKYTYVSTAGVGPKVGRELQQKAFLAIFFSFFAVLVYLAYRFEWRFGVAAVIATFHDIVLTICFIAVMRIEVSLVVVAAVLSMVGYSLNDTIVIFDRVRENLRKNRRDQLVSVLNRSVNETLPRSVLTHCTVLVTLVALIVFAGPVIRPFAEVMFFGVLTGTFSSVFIAAPALLIIEHKWPGVDGRGVRTPGKTPPARGRAQPA